MKSNRRRYQPNLNQTQRRIELDAEESDIEADIETDIEEIQDEEQQ